MKKDSGETASECERRSAASEKQARQKKTSQDEEFEELRYEYRSNLIH